MKYMRGVDAVKKTALEQALVETSGNRVHSAIKLGVCVRTIRNWIKLFDLGTQFPPRSLPTRKPVESVAVTSEPSV